MRKRPIALAVMALVLNLLLCQCGGGSSQKQDATNTGDQLGGLDTSGGQDSTSGLDTSGGLDSTGACTPGQTRCADQTRLETCNSNGIGWSSTTCGNGCNNMVLVHACYPTCKPNDKFCDGDGYQKCNDEGTAYTFVPCEFGCNGNINPVWCYDACRPGSTRCKDATTLETCPADGTDNWTQTTCGANGCNPLVTPAICSTTCPVLKNRCKDGQTQETCNDASTGWDSYSCPSGCQNDACAP